MIELQLMCDTLRGQVLICYATHPGKLYEVCSKPARAFEEIAASGGEERPLGCPDDRLPCREIVGYCCPPNLAPGRLVRGGPGSS